MKFFNTSEKNTGPYTRYIYQELIPSKRDEEEVGQ